MEIEFIVDEKDHIELFFRGEDASFPQALRERLLEEDGIEFVAVVRGHPTADPPKLVLKTKGKDAKALLKSATKELQKEAHAIAAVFKRKA